MKYNRAVSSLTMRQQGQKNALKSLCDTLEKESKKDRNNNYD